MTRCRSNQPEARHRLERQITRSRLAVDTESARRSPRTKPRIRPPLREPVQQTLIWRRKNWRNFLQNFDIRIDPPGKFSLHNDARPKRYMTLLRTHDVSTMLTIKEPGLVVVQYVKPSARAHLINPPVVEGNLSWINHVQRSAQMIGNTRWHHQCISAQHILNQRISELKRASIVAGRTCHAHCSVHNNSTAPVNLSASPTADHIYRAGNLMRHPDVILIGESDPACIMFGPHQKRQKVGRDTALRTFNQRNTTPGMHRLKLRNDLQGSVARPVIADPKAPLLVGLRRNRRKLRREIPCSILCAHQNMNMGNHRIATDTGLQDCATEQTSNPLTINDRACI